MSFCEAVFGSRSKISRHLRFRASGLSHSPTIHLRTSDVMAPYLNCYTAPFSVFSDSHFHGFTARSFPNGERPLAVGVLKSAKKRRIMKILLRDVNTGLYMNSGDWIEDVGQACEFKSGGDAIRFAVKQHLSDIEIIYAFPNPEYNFCAGTRGLRLQTGASATAPGSILRPILLNV